MPLEQKVKEVEKLFEQLEIESARFRQDSGLHCATGCGRCCSFPTIEASPLEFLPWAFHLFLNGKAEETLYLIKDDPRTHCFLFKPVSITGHGHCEQYRYRGLICRLFGFAANRDKYGQLRLASCKIIKENQPYTFAAASVAITQTLQVPVFTEYYMQLAQIDFQMGNVLVPVNQALRIALEEVLHYYTYRPLPDAEKWCL